MLVNNSMRAVLLAENIGAHRKLLPLLSRNAQKDVVIVTVDDDTLYHPKFLEAFITTYLATNKSSVVASRVRAISFCDSWPFRSLPYVYWRKQHCDAVKQKLLVIPTGVGGVLYR